MAKAALDGHRVVLVTATRGEHGEIVPDVLLEGEQLGIRRVAELFESAAALGIHRVELLGYVDSGMVGTLENNGPYSFWTADVESAARRLALIIQEEKEAADGPVVLTVYDGHGIYGHPDHIQVHKVGVRAAEIAGVDRVFEVTVNRDHLRRLFESFAPALEDSGVDVPDFADSDFDGEGFGSVEDAVTHAVDVSDVLSRKREALGAHASQIGPDSFFMTLPVQAFELGFGTEWFILRGSPRSPGSAMTTDLFEGLV